MIIVKCEDLFNILTARPIAAALHLFIIGPPSTNAVLTKKLSTSYGSSFIDKFDIAEFSVFKINFADFLFVYLRIFMYGNFRYV